MVFIEGLKPGRGIKLPPEVREAFAHQSERTARIRAFWEEHTEDLREQYPDQFVAADTETGEVVDTDPDLFALDRRLTEMGITWDDRVAVKFMSTIRYVAW